MLNRKQLKHNIRQAITDALNRQNTAAVVRAVFELLVDNLFAPAEDTMAGMDFTKLPGYDPTVSQVLGHDAQGKLYWTNNNGTGANGYVK